MSLITPAVIQSFAPSDLDDASLQLVIDAEEAAIVRRYGPHASAVETVIGGTRLIALAREAVSITSVVENVTALDSGVTLTTSEYLFTQPYLLERIGSGYGWGARTHEYPYLIWGRQVRITYVPVDETAQRTLALVNLCKLALAFSGYQSVSIPNVVSMTALDYQQQREAILQSVAPRAIGFV